MGDDAEAVKLKGSPERVHGAAVHQRRPGARAAAPVAQHDHQRAQPADSRHERRPRLQQGQHAAAEARPDAGAAAAAPARPWPRPRLGLLTLKLHPPEAEAEFWERFTPEYAATDKWALVLGTVNLATALRNASFLSTPALEPLMRVWLAALVALSAGARGALAAAPERYYRVRWRLALTQRVVRSSWMLVCYACTDWRAFLAAKAAAAAAGGGRGGPGAALVEVAVLLGLLWLMQAVLFPFVFRHAAVVQLAAAARAACAAARRARLAALTAAGAIGPLAPARGAVCEEAAVEYLVTLFSAAGCLLALMILYVRERRLKERYLDSFPPPPAAAGAPPPGRRWLGGPAALYAAAVAVALASFGLAEAAAAWGPRYRC
ncbi:MAG: hypothetical protein J3K34DRAFT_459919 [Monoraphidium minutum]|nr:MAG: hypothetical protein J3K34DRAFT_459919 [Monoraphidium minutum]